jgi:hypothetical protein
MSQDVFFVDKTTHTFSDTLAAFGLAALLQEVLDRANQGGSIRLADEGDTYRLTCEPAIEDDWPEQVAGLPFILAPLIRTPKNAAKLPADLLPTAVVDYEAVRDHRNEYWEARRGLPKEARQALARGEYHPAHDSLPSMPDPRWDIFRAINPAGLAGYNGLMAQWWDSQAALPDLLRLLFGMTANTPNNLDGAEAGWKQLAKEKNLPGAAQATAGQIFNPGQGKGQNRAKADNLSMGNVKSFWLLEWLKAAGFYRAGFTKQLQGVKDRKTYVVAPHDISLKAHQKIMSSFRDKMPFSEAATRSDVLVALRYSQAFLNYCQENQAEDLWAQLMGGGSPSDAVSGFYVAFYKNLGNSAATMNLAFINVPGWMRLYSAGDAEAYLELLGEHEQIVRQLDESHGDAYDLLLRYRDFIAADDLSAFFEFATAYSGYLIGQKERGRYAPQFTGTNLRRLIMGAEPKLSDILDPQKHPGFQSIAYAIRQSTVVAQYRKQQGDRRYDVRYGLGQELARKAKYPAEFITALSDFLHKYNAENAQVMERRAGPYRRSVQVSDIDDIVGLVDEFGSELMCNLLVAYGYARSGAREATPEAVTGEDELEAGSLAAGEDDATDETD